MPAPAPLRRLLPLAAVTLAAVALAACGSSGTPSPHGSGAAGPHRTTTSTAQARSTTSASSAITTTTTTPASTDLTFYPFTAQGSLAQGLQVTQQVTGRCSSPGVAGSLSYRCTAEPGDVAYDPCFAPPVAGEGALVCVPDPTDIDVIRFSAAALPKTSATAPAERVWAMRLHTGEVCILVNAHWDGRGPFACPTPSATGSVADCRTPTKTAHGWSTECQAKENASSPFTTVPVVNVWT